MESLDQQELNAWAKRARLPWRIQCFESVPSTNILVKQAIAQGEPEGYVAAALQQVAGYGRQGRPWVSPFGGLYFSVLLRPDVTPQRLASIGPALSFAVREALADLVSKPGDVLIKWPNDVVCSQGKLCGMSCEYESHAACIGIGINLYPPKHVPDVGGKNRPAYLVDLMDIEHFTGGEAVSSFDPIANPEGLSSAQTAIMQHVLQKTLFELHRAYREWQAGGFSVLQPRYEEHAALIGDYVRAVTITDSLIAEGTVEGIDSSGCLLLRAEDGDLVQVASGEVHLR